MLRVAFRIGAARNAGGLRSAAPAQTLDGGDAVRVGAARRLALVAGRVAKEGRADGDRARAANAAAVADERAGDLGALTGARGADRVERIEPAGSLAVAGSVLPAAPFRVGLTLRRVARLDACGDHRAHAERHRLRAGLAGSLAGGVAAVTLDAELALALRRAGAGEAVVSGRGATGSVRAARPRIGPAVGPSRGPALTTLSAYASGCASAPVRTAPRSRRARTGRRQQHQKRNSTRKAIHVSPNYSFQRCMVRYYISHTLVLGGNAPPRTNSRQKIAVGVGDFDAGGQPDTRSWPRCAQQPGPGLGRPARVRSCVPILRARRRLRRRRCGPRGWLAAVETPAAARRPRSAHTSRCRAWPARPRCRAAR